MQAHLNFTFFVFLNWFLSNICVAMIISEIVEINGGEAQNVCVFLCVPFWD